MPGGLNINTSTLSIIEMGLLAAGGGGGGGSHVDFKKCECPQ